MAAEVSGWILKVESRDCQVEKSDAGKKLLIFDFRFSIENHVIDVLTISNRKSTIENHCPDSALELRLAAAVCYRRLKSAWR